MPNLNSHDAASMREALQAISTSVISDILRKHGPDRWIVREARPLTPAVGTIAGPARTLRFLPPRADASPPRGNVRMRLIDECRAGEVLVFDTHGGAGPVLGDMVAYRAAQNGCAGVVTDGFIRDAAAISELGLAVFARGYAPAPGAGTVVAWDCDIPVQCGGALVLPGDWIVADAEAVMAIPAVLVSELLGGATKFNKEEEFCRALLERGHRLQEVFPLPLHLEPFLERYRHDGQLPSAEEIAQRVSSSADAPGVNRGENS